MLVLMYVGDRMFVGDLFSCRIRDILECSMEFRHRLADFLDFVRMVAVHELLLCICPMQSLQNSKDSNRTASLNLRKSLEMLSR